MDHAVRVERVAAARAVEVELEPFARGALGHLRVQLLRALELIPYLPARRSAAVPSTVRGASGSSSNDAPHHGHFVAVLELLQRGLEASLADVAPRTDDVRPDFHRKRHVTGRHVHPIGRAALNWMIVLLVLFAFVAGAGTALSPCVLPVLPALLAPGATGGRRRPLGIVIGLAVTFTVTIVGWRPSSTASGSAARCVRDLAIVALALFGLAVAVPRLGDRLRRRCRRLARFGPEARRRRLLVRAGRRRGARVRLRAVRGAGARRGRLASAPPRAGRSSIGLAYALGSALVLLVLALAGRRLAGRCAGRR